MIVSEIVTRVQRQFGDEASIQITEADVIRWINDAQRDIALNNGLLQTRATANIVAGDATYTLPPDILTIHSVRFNGLRLRAVSIQEAETQIDNLAESGTPVMFWLWSVKNLQVYPVPTAPITDGLHIIYSRQPVAVTLAADTPELPTQYHNRIVEYCLQQAYELDENWQAASQKQQQFTDGVTRLKADEEWGARDFYPSITSLPERW